MASWHVQDAKARFSELLEETIRMGPQIVTRRGVETAVLVPIEEWKRLQRAAGYNLRAHADSFLQQFAETGLCVLNVPGCHMLPLFTSLRASQVASQLRRVPDQHRLLGRRCEPRP